MSDLISGIEVYLNPNAVWDYFMENMDNLQKKTVILAKNGRTGYEICLTSDHDHPTIEVFLNDTIKEKYQAINAADILAETTRLYADYLIVPKVCTPEKKLTEEEQKERLTSRRDEELTDAFRAFLEVVWKDDPELFYEGIDEEEIDEMLNETLDNIGYGHGLSIYRPCYLQDENNNEFFTMYPYDEV